MKVVSENSEEDIEKRRKERDTALALSEVQRCLRELAANLMRIARSSQGGRPGRVASDIADLVRAFNAHVEVTGHHPHAHDISEALSLRRRYYQPDCSISDEIKNWNPVHAAEDEIMCGALQMAASRILDQSTQERRGEYEVYEGIARLKEARKEREAEWERTKDQRMSEFRAMLEKKRAPKAKKSSKPSKKRTPSKAQSSPA
jgi:hypothetical protein